MRRPTNARHVVVVDPALPDPQHSAGERCMVDLADGLVALGHRASVVGLGHAPANGERLARSLRERGTAAHDAIGVAGLRELLERGDVDVAIVSRPGVAIAVSAARLFADRPGIATAYWGHDLHAARLAAQAGFIPVDEHAARLVGLAERGAWERFGLSVYPTDAEARLVNDHCRAERAIAFPYYRLGPDDLTRGTTAPDERTGMLMVGGAIHAPNVDALRFTVAEILPILRASGSIGPLTVVGAWPSALRRELDGVVFTGNVDDATLRSLHHTHRCLLAPLRFGGGTKRKLVAAMGLGLPVVTTAVGERGLLVRNSRGAADGVTSADDPTGIARSVRALDDTETWQQRADIAHRRAHDVYGAQNYDRRLDDLLVRLSTNGAGG